MPATTGAGGAAAADVVCVVGMHRSGTSVTARLLDLLGVYLGPEDELLRAAPGDNPTGFWEHEAMLTVNEDILAALGGTWIDPPPAGGWVDDPRLAPLRERAAALLETSFGGRPLWGWKDPRTSVLLPFWQELLPRMRYVICIREPGDVAASVAERDSLAPARAYELWLRYTEEALAHSLGAPRIVVAYDDTIADPVRQLKRLARFVGPPAAVDRATAAAALSFVDPALRHHHAPAAVPDDARSLYDGLAGAAAASPASVRRLQSLRRRLRARSER